SERRAAADGRALAGDQETVCRRRIGEDHGGRRPHDHRDAALRLRRRGHPERGQHDGQSYNPATPSRLQRGRFSMKRKAYGRDAGLSLRMLLTSVLLGLLYVFFALVLFYIFNAGLVLMLVLVIGMALFQYFTSDKLALRASGAKIVTPEEAPKLHEMVERLAAMADLQKPRVAIVDTPVPNAFATGRNQKHAVVAVTSGLWERLDEKEIEGVLAHELTHIANRDVLVMTVASFFAMLAAMLTRFGFYAGMCGGWGGGNRDSNNNSVPVWLVVMVVSIVT